MVIVCPDLEWENKGGDTKKGFFMDGYLVQNLSPIYDVFIKQKYDCVGIISGHNKVGVGKSTMASQVGYFLAWTLAGGKITWKDYKNSPTEYEIAKIPKKEINFSLDNVCFTPEELMEKAQRFPKNSVLIYDEGRAGLDSKRAMENINKTMEDFFQECRSLGHIILIVLPNFFKLHEDYAVIRSIFLIDVYHDERYKRGNFSFYNEIRKEFLFVFGKKVLGSWKKYSMTDPNFFGKFTAFFPFDEKEYEERKKIALRRKTKKRKHVERWKKMIGIIINVLRDVKKYSDQEIVDILKKRDFKVARRTITSLRTVKIE